MIENKFVITVPFLSSDECSKLIHDSIQWKEGQVDSVLSSLSEKSNDIRKVQLSGDAITKELQDKIYKQISNINAKNYNVNLQGFSKKDPPSILKYAADRKDHYTWHVDTPLIKTNTLFARKLSFTIQLTDPNDYVGGDLEFESDVKHSDIRPQGHITIFPSTLLHRVTPVTEGIRYSMVGWIWGDNDFFEV